MNLTSLLSIALIIAVANSSFTANKLDVVAKDKAADKEKGHKLQPKGIK
jgi:hypothetical protein